MKTINIIKPSMIVKKMSCKMKKMCSRIMLFLSINKNFQARGKHKVKLITLDKYF